MSGVSSALAVVSSECEDMHTALYELRQSSSLCDVCLVDDTGVALMAHSCILAAGSPILKNMLLLKQTANMMKKQGLSVKIQFLVDQSGNLVSIYAKNKSEQSSSLCDVCLVDDTGVALMAHSCILAAGSPILKNMLLLKQTANMMKKQGLSVKVKGISCEIWEVLLQYFYLGKITVSLNEKLIENIYCAAKMLGVSALANSISSYSKQLGFTEGIQLRQNVASINVTLAPTLNVEQCHQGVQTEEEGGYGEEETEDSYQEVVVKSENTGVHEIVPEPVTEKSLEVGMVPVSTEKSTVPQTQGTKPVPISKPMAIFPKKILKITPAKRNVVKNKSLVKIQKVVPVKSEVMGADVADDGEEDHYEALEEADEEMDTSENVEDKTPHKHWAHKSKPKHVSGPRKDETLVKCPNEECTEEFSNQAQHREFMEHLVKCLMTDGSQLPLHFVHERDEETLIYDDGLRNEGTPEVELTAMVLRYTNGVAHYKCQLCQVTGNLEKIANHLSVVHGKRKPFCCKFCQASYGYMDSFQDHYISQHTRQTFACRQCEGIFNKKDTLRRHVLIEHKREGLETHSCKDCGKTFKLSQHARRHEKYHKDATSRPFGCQFCDKRFVTRQEQGRHMDIHTGVKSFMCTRCDFVTARKSNLIIHERKHGVVYGEYVCTSCDKYFVSESRFRSHVEQKKHHGGHISQFVSEDLSSFDPPSDADHQQQQHHQDGGNQQVLQVLKTAVESGNLVSVPGGNIHVYHNGLEMQSVEMMLAEQGRGQEVVVESVEGGELGTGGGVVVETQPMVQGGEVETQTVVESDAVQEGNGTVTVYLDDNNQLVQVQT